MNFNVCSFMNNTKNCWNIFPVLENYYLINREALTSLPKCSPNIHLCCFTFILLINVKKNHQHSCLNFSGMSAFFAELNINQIWSFAKHNCSYRLTMGTRVWQKPLKPIWKSMGYIEFTVKSVFYSFLVNCMLCILCISKTV